MKTPLIIRVGEAGEEAAVRRAADELNKGGLAVIPTDTVYGIAVQPNAPGAERRLFEAKGRDARKPVALLASDMAAVTRCGACLDGPALRLAERFWPGALTLVLETPSGFEGFRIPNHSLTLALLRACGGMLRTSSANRSGEAPALTAEEALRSFGGDLDVVLDAGAASGGTPSTVVRVKGGRIEILREGAIAAAAVRAAAGGSASPRG
jgi:L-threonylcarbamoyladenylate synthase